MTKDAFQQLLGKEPKVAAIHAGLECGIIGEKVPGMDAVSYGPTITGAHSPDEQVSHVTLLLLGLYWLYSQYNAPWAPNKYIGTILVVLHLMQLHGNRDRSCLCVILKVLVAKQHISDQVCEFMIGFCLGCQRYLRACCR